MKKMGTFTAGLLLILFVSTGMTQTFPVDNDFHSRQNDIIDRLVDLGVLEPDFPNSRPYRIDDIREAVYDAIYLSQNQYNELLRSQLESLRISLNHLKPEDERLILNLDLSSEGIHPEQGKSFTSETLRGIFGIELKDNVNLFTEFALDESLADDPLYEGKVWRSLAGQVERAYLELDFDNIQVYFGREKSSWGPGRRGNLLLSSHSRAMDQAKLTASYGPLKFTSIIAVLDQEDNELALSDTTLDWDINRYFSAHRLEIMPYDKLSIGLAESVIYGGTGRGLEFYYTNPITWYHGEQLNQDNDDNTFISVDASWYPVWGVKLYGEFLIDDYQVDNETPGDNEPSEIGYLAGVNLIEPIEGSGVDFGFEYTRVNNWTYNQIKSHNRYVHNNRLIGHFLGPDRESMYFALKKWFSFGAKAVLTYERQNSGEGNVFSDWTAPWLYASEAYEENFPSGVVEKADILGLSLKLFKWNNLQIDFDNYLIFYNNKDNIEGNSSSNYRGRFQVRYLLDILG